MVQLLSLPLFVTSSISLILGIFFLLLYYRLTLHHKEQVKYYLIFALSAFLSGIFFGAFAVLLNSSNNLDTLNISNRVTIISAMFTIVTSLHFYVSFYNYTAPVLLKWCYAICGIFSILTIVPNQYFLSKSFYLTSEYYVGLKFGPLFEAWGLWVLLLAAYCIFVLVKVYIRQRNKQSSGATKTVQLLLFSNIVWMIMGVSDTLTGIQVIDLPPLTWIGAFLVILSIAWVLILHIDELYEDRRHLNDRLMYDHLTQAFSRSYLDIRLNHAISSMSSQDLHRVSVCIFDIDNFKSINDHYGHDSGDNLLTHITKITKENIRPSDCVSRLGGDEFVILLCEKTDDDKSHWIIERIRKIISETTFGINGVQFTASCSFGLVSAESKHAAQHDLANQMMKKADDALYDAKRKGKNTLSIFTL